MMQWVLVMTLYSGYPLVIEFASQAECERGAKLIRDFLLWEIPEDKRHDYFHYICIHRSAPGAATAEETPA